MNAKYYPLIKLARQAALIKRRFTLPFKLFSSGFVRSESYYPELPHKSRFRIVLELLGHIMKYGSIEWHYFSYGLDIKGFRDKNDYLDDGWFLWRSAMLNTVLVEHDYTCILRDKDLFATLLTDWGFETPHTIACVRSIKDIDTAIEKVFSNKGAFFCKPLDGQCGGGVFRLVVSDDRAMIDGEDMTYDDAEKILKERFEQSAYLIQTLVVQHPEVSKIYDKSVNTIRLITVYDKKNNKVVPLSAVLRVGANGNTVDNWAAGGLAVGIEMETGRLKEYGFYKHGKGTKTVCHPDTGTEFNGFKIPFYTEAVEKAVSLHTHLVPIVVIGWDIAITPNGPLFIEGNDNMEISINQEVNGGLKKACNHLIF